MIQQGFGLPASFRRRPGRARRGLPLDGWTRDW